MKFLKISKIGLFFISISWLIIFSYVFLWVQSMFIAFFPKAFLIFKIFAYIFFGVLLFIISLNAFIFPLYKFYISIKEGKKSKKIISTIELCFNTFYLLLIFFLIVVFLRNNQIFVFQKRTLKEQAKSFSSFFDISIWKEFFQLPQLNNIYWYLSYALISIYFLVSLVSLLFFLLRKEKKVILGKKNHEKKVIQDIKRKVFPYLIKKWHFTSRSSKLEEIYEYFIKDINEKYSQKKWENLKLKIKKSLLDSFDNYLNNVFDPKVKTFNNSSKKTIGYFAQNYFFKNEIIDRKINLDKDLIAIEKDLQYPFIPQQNKINQTKNFVNFSCRPDFIINKEIYEIKGLQKIEKPEYISFKIRKAHILQLKLYLYCQLKENKDFSQKIINIFSKNWREKKTDFFSKKINKKIFLDGKTISGYLVCYNVKTKKEIKKEKIFLEWKDFYIFYEIDYLMNQIKNSFFKKT